MLVVHHHNGNASAAQAADNGQAVEVSANNQCADDRLLVAVRILDGT